MIINLPRHLREKHKWSSQDACAARGVFDLRKGRKDVDSTSNQRNYQKHVCPICKKVVRRIHDHLYKSPHFLKNDRTKYRAMLEQKKEFVSTLTINTQSLCVSKCLDMKKRNNYNDVNFASVDKDDKNKEECFTENYKYAEEEKNFTEEESYYENEVDKPVMSMQSQEPIFKDYLEVFNLYLKSRSGGNKDFKSANNEMAQVRRIIEVVSPIEQDYTKLFDLHELKNVWFPHAKVKKFEPGTKRSYFLSLGHFMDFMIRSKLTPNVCNVLPVDRLSADVMNVCSNEISKWRKSLRVEEDARQFEVMTDDYENSIPIEDFQAVLSSSFYIEITTKIKEIGLKYFSDPSSFDVTRMMYTNARDSLFFNLIVNNISRSGSVSNMTVAEYLRGSVTNGQFIVSVKKHKTASSYGDCQIVIKDDIKCLYDTFYSVIRSNVPGVKSPNFFITWSGCPIESGGVSTQLNTFFGKCLPSYKLDGKKSVSATLIRKSLLTFFYDKHPEMKEKLATLMKHKRSTVEKWYYLNQT